jgi:PAS domain-containing protein
MKTVCAWCSIDISPPGITVAGVSHGICLPCANRIIVHTPFDLRSFLDDVAVPVALVDSAGIVKVVNDKAKAMIGLDQSRIEGLPGGDVFQCIYARLPEGCGNTIHCSGCVIRRTVMETSATGLARSRVPATLKQQTAAGPQDIRFLISTDKLGDCVLLRIDRRVDGNEAPGDVARKHGECRDFAER